ncbi:hypothetical protein CONLIGDRAFT_634205 [Coniochaeta ligniaria NRRL 30616]|uniref:Uncharacterized protein n=1 Tax=Coniochaeta ligniaria NRRL 30616 TaxID=1408157 RepID=A0A1J7IKR4_9PEZI|nr:hypothetical protein CONLIGDRAFT_634205 [Coniochaeta ligniaria NRRL 30616]
MSLLRNRMLPLAGVAALGSFMLWQTYGGAKEPRSRASKPESQQLPVSETLQSIGGQGGRNAADRESSYNNPHQDTRQYSNSPDAASKKNPGKVRPLDREELGPVNPGPDGKNIGDRSSDLPWKRGEGRGKPE